MEVEGGGGGYVDFISGEWSEVEPVILFAFFFFFFFFKFSFVFS